MIYLDLFHGRYSPEEELDDWGFSGPVIGPFPYFHLTYGSHFKFGDEAMAVDLDSLFTLRQDGLIEFLGAYYGDMSIIRSLEEGGLQRRHTETQTVFATELPLLVGSKEPWVKLYAAFCLKHPIQDAAKFLSNLKE